jgi:cyclase
MFRPRIIPVLLLRQRGLVKTVQFGKSNYIGDPINAVRIFNELKADELIFIDIDASAQKRLISVETMKEIGEEANMPFAAGGGIRTLEDIRLLLLSGAEKVIINIQAIEDPSFIREASTSFGSSTIAVCMDVKKNWWGKVGVYHHRKKKIINETPVNYAKRIEELGAGELVVQSVDRDGMMQGYDIELLEEIASAVSIPVVALGGAGSLADLQHAYTTLGIQGLAAGSLFVYNNKNKGVLINYPDRITKKKLFQQSPSSLR